MVRPFELGKIPEFFLEIIPALTVTLEYVALAFVFGLLFGLLLSLVKVSKSRVLRSLAYGYTTVMRCTPSIVLLFLVYYGVPRLFTYFFGIQLDTSKRVKFIVITLAMFCASSLSEVLRSCYESLDKSQLEAADSVGMTRVQAFWHILLPQMLYLAIPNFCNTLLVLLKEGALAYTIGLFDLLGQANYVIGLNMGAYVIEVYITLALIYWPIALFITHISGYLEKQFDYGNKHRKRRGMTSA